MTKQFYQRHTREFFIGKRVKLLRTIRNRAGEQIEEGAIATIDDKFAGFGLLAPGAYIKGIPPCDVDLLGS